MHFAAQKERGEVRNKEMEDEDEGRLEVIPTYSLTHSMKQSPS
jgi:hypothetical protein